MADAVTLEDGQTVQRSRPAARSSALVEKFAPIATLTETMAVRVASQPPSSQDRETVFSMMSNLLCDGRVMATRSARDTGPKERIFDGRSCALRSVAEM